MDLIPKRYILTALSFLGFLNLYLMRSNMGVAIVAMVKHGAHDLIHPTHNHSKLFIDGINDTLLESDFGEGCHNWHPSANDSVSTETGGEFDWDRTTQAYVLSSFFFGYIFSQIPGGYLSTRFGPTKVLALGLGGAGLMTALTPIAAYIHVYLLVACRILLGFFEGVFVPSNHVVWSRWAPPFERTKLVAIAFSGCHIGIVLAMFGSGALASFFGWPSIFYVHAFLAFLWVFLWLMTATDSPTDPNSGVSPDELAHILNLDHEQTENTSGTAFRSRVSTVSSTAPCIVDREKLEEKVKAVREEQREVSNNHLSTPWVKIFTSTAVWAIICAHVSHTWFFYTLMTQMAIYINDELHLSIIHNGFISAIPFLSFFVGQVASSYLCDWLRENTELSTTSIRKGFFGLGALLASVFIIALTFVGCNLSMIIPMVAVSANCAGWTVCGFFMNHIDIAPRYAGILMGITNGLATFPGIISPHVTSLLTVESATGSPSVVEREWRYVFALAAIIHVIGAIVFVLLGSGIEQNWAKVHDTSNEPKIVSEEPSNSQSNSESSSSMELNNLKVQSKPVEE